MERPLLIWPANKAKLLLLDYFCNRLFLKHLKGSTKRAIPLCLLPVFLSIQDTRKNYFGRY